MQVIFATFPVFVVTSVGKIPEILSPVPTPKFGDFWGFSHKKSPKFEFPPSPKYPQTFYGLKPRPQPRNSGIFGDEPQKIPKIMIVPVPKLSPKVLKTLPPTPNYPQTFGDFRGKPQKTPKFRLCLSLKYTKI